MRRDIGNEFVVAIIAIGVLAFVITFTIILSLSGINPDSESAPASSPTTIVIAPTDAQSLLSPTPAASQTPEPPSATPTPTSTLTATSTAPLPTTAPATPTAAQTTSTPMRQSTQAATTAPAAQTPTPTLSPTLTLTQTPRPTQLPATATPTPTLTLTATATPTPSPSATPTLTVTPTPSPTPTRTPTATPTPTRTPTVTPTPSPTSTLTSTPTATPTPTLPASPGCTPPTGWTTYTVRRGETLSQIASFFGTTIDALQAANCIPNVNNIRAGSVIYVPASLTPTPSSSAPALTREGCTDPGVQITNLEPGQLVNSSFALIGTAYTDYFRYYQIDIRPDGAPDYSLYSQSTVPVVQGLLGVLEPRTIGSGLFWVRLTVVSDTFRVPCAIPVLIP